MTGTRKKRIAFLSFDWDYEIVAEYYRGMQEYLRGVVDVQLVIFSAFSHYHLRFDPDMGSHKVFTLFDPEKFDGLMVQGNRVWPPEMRQAYVDRMHALGKPVLSINYDLDNAHVVGTDNYKAMYGLVDRILSERQVQSPAYINGLETSVEAQARAQAYLDACAAHGLHYPRFYQANWQLESGAQAAEEILQSSEGLPDALFCCNDDLAIGAMEVMQAAGLQVPEDLLITGFDNREISRCVLPPITTVDRDYVTVGKTALYTMHCLLEGEKLPHEVYSPVRYCLRESCGYAPEADAGPRGSLYSLDNTLKRFYEVIYNFESAMFSARSLKEVLKVCEQFAPEIHSQGVFVTLNDRYLHFDLEQDLSDYAPISHFVAYATASRQDIASRGDAHGTPGRSKVADKGFSLAYNERHVYTSFPTDEILPEVAQNGAPLYIVYPLRRGSTCIGTLVTEGLSPLMQHGFLTFSLTLLSAGIENVRNMELLSAANSRLDNLYVHDELTGLFNRFGLDRFGVIAYEHLLRDFEHAHFIFVDVDDMKGINDRFGHEEGDNALRETADIIRRASMGENVFSMRYGGDEFLLICRNDLTQRLEEELELLKKSVARPYDLRLSIGVIKVVTGDHLTMDEAIRKADARMYDIKKARKSLRE